MSDKLHTLIYHLFGPKYFLNNYSCFANVEPEIPKCSVIPAIFAKELSQEFHSKSV